MLLRCKHARCGMMHASRVYQDQMWTQHKLPMSIWTLKAAEPGAP